MDKLDLIMQKRAISFFLCLSLTAIPALSGFVEEDETSTTTKPETETVAPADETDAETPVPAAPETSVPVPSAETSDSAPAPDAGDDILIGVVNPFEDVKADSPFLPGILYAVEKKITNGTTAKTFSPYAICTHAQILTFLWRGAGSPKPTIDNPFPNVKTNAYYYQAALWSYEKGMIGDSFDPYAYCTRLQAVTYLWTLCGAPDAGQSGGFPFTDVPDNFDARAAVAWAVAEGITNGATTTTFSPDKRCTRAQIVTFIYRGRDLLANA